MVQYLIGECQINYRGTPPPADSRIIVTLLLHTDPHKLPTSTLNPIAPIEKFIRLYLPIHKLDEGARESRRYEIVIPFWHIGKESVYQ